MNKTARLREKIYPFILNSVVIDFHQTLLIFVLMIFSTRLG